MIHKLVSLKGGDVALCGASNGYVMDEASLVTCKACEGWMVQSAVSYYQMLPTTRSMRIKRRRRGWG